MKRVITTSFRSACFLTMAIFLFGSTMSLGQTIVVSPMNSTPVAGEYYHTNAITLSPGFSFSATPGNNLWLHIIPTFCFTGPPLSPSFEMNYRVSQVARVPINVNAGTSNSTTCEVIKSVEYFDGLGRPIQVVKTKASQLGKDIVQIMSYDEFGREDKSYLPYASMSGPNDGSFKSSAMNAQYDFYYPAPLSGITPNAFAYAKKVFEQSPLNRIIEQGGEGAVWQPSTERTQTAGRTQTADFALNNLSDFDPNLFTNNPGSRKVSLYQVDASGALSRGSNLFYEPNQLSVTISRNENWVLSDGCLGTSEEYTDKSGRVVLKRSYNLKEGTTTIAEMLSTYFVYDDLGSLRYVLSPKAGGDRQSGVPTPEEITGFCFRYKYDILGRIMAKSTPGKDWEYMIYNKLGQVVLTQDGLLRADNNWKIVKYDVFGRVIMSGIWQAPPTTTMQDIQSAVSSGPQWDERDYTNLTTGYNVSTYPAITTLLTVNYYDNYNTIPGLPSTYFPVAYSTRTKGLLTAFKVAVLNNPADMLLTANFYNENGKISIAYQQHYKGGFIKPGNYDEVSNTYDFVNDVTTTTRKHYIHISDGSNPTLAFTIFNRYNYDHMNRKTETYEKIGTAISPEVLISQLKYNEVGQLILKSVNNGLQNSNYSYNERGWLTKINQPSSPGYDHVFGMEMIYNSSEPGAQYNGNISKIKWQVAVPPHMAGVPGFVDPGQQSYAYSYDKTNRLTFANYSGNGSNGKFDEKMSYDQNGNIETLKRKNSVIGYVNDFNYNYTNNGVGNKLWQVDDNGTGNQGSVYQYNANGNVINDSRNHITAIKYNSMNLPQLVTRTQGNITYFYDALGKKLRKVRGTSQRDYINGIEYQDNILDLISTDEGRALPVGNGNFSYEYFLKDNIGNTRAVVKDDQSIVQIQDYYPFGLDLNSGNSYNPSVANNYKFNGKEKQEETGQYDYGARLYDPVIGRWTSVDPLAEKGYTLTPFRYAFNNPVRITDPNGAYEEDGHYWTVYLMLTMMGDKNAFNISYWTEYPDQSMYQSGDRESFNNTWGHPYAQQYIHALTGGSSVAERNTSYGYAVSSSTSVDLGTALHRLGDSYAHSVFGDEKRMYGGNFFTLGHALESGSGDPDMIKNRPWLYRMYVDRLSDVLKQRLGMKGKLDMYTFDYVAYSGGSTAQNSAVFETEISIRQGLNSFSVEGDQVDAVNSYVQASNTHFGRNVKAQSVYTWVDVYNRDKDGNWVKTKSERRTFTTLE
jgi:RHS repeat-associated protein